MADQGFARSSWGGCGVWGWLAGFLVASTGWLIGCSADASAVDPAPFRAAVVAYLEQNGMQLKIKDIRQGPAVAGETATMTAAMTHADLGGPSVVWEFQFEKAAGGTWTVRQHTVR